MQANDYAEDGKEMNFDTRTTKIKDVMAEVDRHSRLLARQEDLNSS
jgi:large subunit ribosomal protein L53